MSDIIGAGHRPGGDRDDGRARDSSGGGGGAPGLPAGRHRADRRARRPRARKSRALFDAWSSDLPARTARRTIEVARDDEQRARIWRGRKAAFAAMGRVSPNYYVQDGVVPRTRLPEVLGRIRELERASGLRIGNVFHAGDGNLHPLICYDERVPGQAGSGRRRRGRDPLLLRRGRRLDHRRARRRRRQDGVHAEDVQRRRPRRDAARARGVRPARISAIPARCFRRRACAAKCPARTASIRPKRPGSRSGSDDGHGRRRCARSAQRSRSGPRVRGRRDARRHRRSRPSSWSSPTTPRPWRRCSPGPRRPACSVVIRGGGTKLDWGRPPGGVDLVVDTAAAAIACSRTQPGDLTATSKPGSSLREVNDALARHGQWLPLDRRSRIAPRSAALLATNDSGPLRHRYGTPRDLIIGVRWRPPTAGWPKAGGQVVKNVAGYDLASSSADRSAALAAIVSATFKLVAAAGGVDDARDRRRRRRGDGLAAAVGDVSASQLDPLRASKSSATRQGVSEHRLSRAVRRRSPAVVDAAGRAASRPARRRVRPRRCEIVDGDREADAVAGSRAAPWTGAGADRARQLAAGARLGRVLGALAKLRRRARHRARAAAPRSAPAAFTSQGDAGRRSRSRRRRGCVTAGRSSGTSSSRAAGEREGDRADVWGPGDRGRHCWRAEARARSGRDPQRGAGAHLSVSSRRCQTLRRVPTRHPSTHARSTRACTAASVCRRARPTCSGARRWTRRAGGST